MPKTRNRAKCKKCGDIIESKYRHDFVTCKCGAISVDGGEDYIRRAGMPEDFDGGFIYKEPKRSKSTGPRKGGNI